MKSYSQANQDIFVRIMTNNKKNGTFLEIGSNDPIIHNNSYILETENNYRGIMVEYDKSFEEKYKIYRPNSIYILNDAQNIDYKTFLQNNNFPYEIDYLQIDLDVDNRSTLNTLELLNDSILDVYKFATITFEHDIYNGNYYNTRNISRNIFYNKGYELIFPDVSVYWEGKYSQFEDWYVHPKLVNNDLIKKYKTDKSLTCDEIYELLVKDITHTI